MVQDPFSATFDGMPRAAIGAGVADLVVAAPEMPVMAELSRPSARLQDQMAEVLLGSFAPPALLCSAQGDILQINGRTGKFLEPAAGRANWNLFVMAKEGLRSELTVAFRKLARKPGKLLLRGLEVGAGRARQTVDVVVQSLEQPAPLRGAVLVVFNEAAPAQPAAKPARRDKGSRLAQERGADLERELRHLRHELLISREELQVSQEAARSSSEELQSTVEELQSTNEELTTSKEELQSLNEELHTVNAEQAAKMDEFLIANSDLKNLLNSTNVAIMFLDRGLHVRRFTPGVGRIFRLQPSDVGRPITDIANDLSYPELPDDVREVLRTLLPAEKEIKSRTSAPRVHQRRRVYARGERVPRARAHRMSRQALQQRAGEPSPAGAPRVARLTDGVMRRQPAKT